MPRSPDQVSPAAELSRLLKSYREGERERVVLRDVDLCVARGEIVVLLGRSGSGKSTLLNLVSGIDRPTSGIVRVEGVDVAALSETEHTLFRRRRIGFIFQFFNLIPTLTVEENLSHSEEVAALADRVLTLADGRLCERVAP